MSTDDDRKQEAVDVGGDYALEMDEDLLAEALAAVERRVEEGKRATEPPSDEALAEVARDIELALDEGDGFDELDELELADEAPPAAPEGDDEARSEQLRGLGDALLEQNEQLLERIAELELELAEAEGRIEEAEARAKDALRKASMLVIKMRQRDDKTEVLRTRLSDARAQLRDWEPLLNELKDKVRGAEAERERLKGRHGREMEEVRNFGSERVFKALLPVLDHFGLVLQHADGDADKLAEGVQMTVRQLFTTLERQGLVRVPVEPGQPFDPEQHEAISRVESEEHPDGTVLEVFQDGYLLNGRLLRAARAAVATDPDELPADLDDADLVPLGEE